MARGHVRTSHSFNGFTIVELLIVIVVIAVLAAIILVSYNGITQAAQTASMKATLDQWRTQAAVYRAQNDLPDCPTGYSFVYGNSVLGTSDFCVMKYEAKNDGSGNAVSTAAGTPWVSISQTDAITAATAAGGHLITEAEWMTIAADVLSVKFNWSGGAVGSGIIYQGHVQFDPASALAASDDDYDDLYGITGSTGTTSGANGSRVLWLKSGDAIWDFSGNVWEWTQQAIGTPTLAVSNIGVSGDSTWNWRDYTTSGLSFGNLATVSKPSILNSIPALSGLTWAADSGVGQIYADYADTASRASIRGGYWGYGLYAGVLTLDLKNSPAGTNTALGFRVAK